MLSVAVADEMFAGTVAGAVAEIVAGAAGADDVEIEIVLAVASASSLPASAVAEAAEEACAND